MMTNKKQIAALRLTIKWFQKQIKPITFPSTLNLKNQKIKVFKPDFDIFWNILNEKV